MSTNIYKDQMQRAELFGKPVLHTTQDIPREMVPEGWHCYELCGTERRPHKPSAIMDHVVWGRLGTVLSPVPLKRPSTEVRQIKDTLILTKETMDLSTFCREQNLPCPSDPRKFILRPASAQEAGLFYSRMEPEQDAAEGTVGHVRMDFGGGRLHHSWWPHNDDRFNTPEFKTALQEYRKRNAVPVLTGVRISTLRSNATQSGHAFFAPHLLYPAVLNDAVLEERQAGIEMGLTLLYRCDELWAFGPTVSSGMQAEIAEAERLRIPVRRMDVPEMQLEGPAL